MQISDQAALAEVGRMALELRLQADYIGQLETEVRRLRGEDAAPEPPVADGQRD